MKVSTDTHLLSQHPVHLLRCLLLTVGVEGETVQEIREGGGSGVIASQEEQHGVSQHLVMAQTYTCDSLLTPHLKGGCLFYFFINYRNVFSHQNTGEG